MADQKKIHTNLRLAPEVVAAVSKIAAGSGQSPSWWMENIIATALNVRGWPKMPKGIKKAKEIAK